MSVLTPSFNQARWLSDNLASVAAQTYPHVEHIVMDGGSTDGSIEILGAASPRVTWVSEADRGQSHAINKAFRASSGEIIGWLNSDDAYFSPTVVQEVVELFVTHLDVAVVYGHAALVNAGGRILQVVWVPPFRRSLLSLTNFIVQPAAFIRRSAIDSTLVDERYDFAMDRELWLRLARSHRFLRIDDILAIDRHQPGRKVYTQQALGRADTASLVRDHGIPAGAWASMRRKFAKVIFRLAGASKVASASRSPLAFGGHRDPALHLLGRQLFVPRSRMPMEDPG